MHILLVEDDHSIATALVQALATAYEVDHVPSGGEALLKAAGYNYDLIILDLQLPDMDGLNICQKLRAGHYQNPILILTGESKAVTKITLLDAGADDYLTKPFSLGELKARLRALDRRQSAKNTPYAQELVVADLVLNTATFEVTRSGLPIKLRRKEFAMLECLMQHAGLVVTREILGSYAWDTAEPWANTIDVHIKHLRDKVDRPFDVPMIATVHGLGYRLQTDGVRKAKTKLAQKEPIGV